MNNIADLVNCRPDWVRYERSNQVYENYDQIITTKKVITFSIVFTI